MGDPSIKDSVPLLEPVAEPDVEFAEEPMTADPYAATEAALDAGTDAATEAAADAEKKAAAEAQVGISGYQN